MLGLHLLGFCYCLMDVAVGGPRPSGCTSGPAGILVRVCAARCSVGPVSCPTCLPSLILAEQSGECVSLREWVTTSWQLRLSCGDASVPKRSRHTAGWSGLLAFIWNRERSLLATPLCSKCSSTFLYILSFLQTSEVDRCLLSLASCCAFSILLLCTPP